MTRICRVIGLHTDWFGHSLAVSDKTRVQDRPSVAGIWGRCLEIASGREAGDLGPHLVMGA